MIFWYRKNILSKTQLKKLSEHKHNSESNSLCDKFMQPWWSFLVSKTPLYIAPNLLTITGLLVIIITSLLLLYHSSDAKAYAPRWCYLLCAVGLFIFQTLDAMDGKQARRTNTSSPLGELFDHGCDSISTVFINIAICCAGGLGYHPIAMLLYYAITMIIFYLTHWQAYITGIMHFGKFDVTEEQFCLIGVHLISFFFGPQVWHVQIFGEIQLWYLIPSFALILVSMVIINFVQVVRKTGIEKNGTTTAGTSIIAPVFPFLFVMISAFIISKRSRSQIFLNHPVLFLLTFGVHAAKVSCRLVVAHMSKSEMNFLDSGLVGPLLLLLNQYFNEFFNESYLLWLAFLWCTYDLVNYCSTVCLEIVSYLNICLFKIPYPPKSYKIVDSEKYTENSKLAKNLKINLT